MMMSLELARGRNDHPLSLIGNAAVLLEPIYHELKIILFRGFEFFLFIRLRESDVEFLVDPS